MKVNDGIKITEAENLIDTYKGDIEKAKDFAKQTGKRIEDRHWEAAERRINSRGSRK